MPLFDLIPDPEVVIALEPDELGLRVLQHLKGTEQCQVHGLVSSVLGDPRLAGNHPGSVGHHPPHYRREIEQALREAWAWLEGQALLVEHPGYASPNTVRKLSRRAVRLANEPDPRRAFSARRISKDALRLSHRDQNPGPDDGVRPGLPGGQLARVVVDG